MPIKMALYLSDKFHSENLGFWHTSKEVFSYLLYQKNVIRKFQVLRRLPRKTVLHFLSKFCICENCINIQSPRRFDLSFCRPQIKCLGNSNMKKKGFRKVSMYASLSHKKMVLHLSTKFGILEPSNKIQSFRRSNLNFCLTQNKFLA